jgi:hypothetical protein
MNEIVTVDPKDLKIEELQSIVKSQQIEIQRIEDEMETERRNYKRIRDALHADSVELQNVKAQMRLNISKKVELDYFQIKDGHLPVLWVNAWNQDLFPAQAFTQMADRIKRMNSGIDMIILTYGVESLAQMDDQDLQRIGLYRDLNQTGLQVAKTKLAIGLND